MTKKSKKVAVLMGGFTTERDVSLRSGAAIARGLRAKGHTVTEVDIESREFVLPAKTDVVFIALHGEFGEDGELQSMLEARGVPYTGSGPESCRIAFDKRLTREALVAAGIPVPPGEILRAPTPLCPIELPAVVKPTRQGSSVGCHRVLDADDWYETVRDALSYNGEAVVETYIPGRELTVGIVGERVLPLVEIRAPGGCYDYRAKYTAGITEYLCPAPLKMAETEEVQALAGRVFEVLKGRGLGRVDLRMTPEGGFYVLELNSIPGFTETSLLPKAAAVAGLDFPDLCDRILNLALAAC
ncbi:MAG: D-alanine--D-alanine ligase [Verrucomicrobia bacterium]|nr:D-alanine--D-alanine ligase [Verrucomicrobiota bacterium]